MLEIKNITKVYKTTGFTQKALDNVSVNFRKNEFTSILGPSGSGKTTLLNIIGGLDHYDSGNLIINETSTKKYKDRDWDSYRNHRIGFVFQSYNLISHQTILSNVELALTISGISKKKRIIMAKKALEEVGLKDHMNKKPSQLSGGQMQRVAIARALVNDPEILLADEPTGALDTNTSKQIMELLKKISKDKLVIMVTHNPELAKKYSTRIVKLQDGKIISDSNPYDGEENTKLNTENKKKKTKRTSMNFVTALSLSLNNLMTKKARTILTAFAGSIGIIGIALILSLSSGVNNYINNIQKETMTSYPITIEKESYDLNSVFSNRKNKDNNKSNNKTGIYSDNTSLETASSMTNSLTENNLELFKKYLDNNKKISKYIGDLGIVYSYDTKFKVWSYDKDNNLINSDGSSFNIKSANTTINNGIMTTNMTFKQNSLWTEVMSDKDNNVSTVIKENYKMVKGSWPKNYNEVLLVLDENNEIPLADLYNLAILPASEYREIIDRLDNKEKLNLEKIKVNYEDIINKEYNLLLASDLYVKNDKGLYDNIEKLDGKVEEVLKNKSINLKVVGIIKQKKSSKTSLIKSTMIYTRGLTEYLINKNNSNEVIKEQIDNQEINVLNGLKFTISNDDEKIEETKKYLKNLNVSEKAKIASTLLIQANSKFSDKILSMSEVELANSLDMYLLNPNREYLLNIYKNYVTSGSYFENLDLIGYVNLNKPSRIDIYTDSFENKDKITKIIEKYNKKHDKKDKITWTDYVGLLMSSVTTIVNAISYILIAFVSISLIVSSIMISIITYISVLERTKEIGILRAIGASKKDIKNVFNAETFIEGLTAGLIGILITILLNIPINKIIYKLSDIENISKLPLNGAIVLIIISILLTVIAGLIPSRLAAKKDPVESLRSE